MSSHYLSPELKPTTNFAGYANPEVDKLLLAANATVERDKRKAAYEALQKQVTDDGPFILMFQPANQVASRVNVSGYKPGIIEDLYFYRTITKS